MNDYRHIPIEKIIENYKISKQPPILNYVLKKISGRFGLTQVLAYKRTLKRWGRGIKPYMPKKLPENSHLYDFHSHTSISDGAGTHQSILEILSKKQCLDGLVFSDHPWFIKNKFDSKRIDNPKVIDQSFKAQEIIEDFKKKGKLQEHFISFPGSCEFAVRLSEKYPNSEIELVTLGLPRTIINDLGGLKRIKNMYAPDFIEKIHDNNGIVILPHPFHFIRGYELLRMKLSKNSRPDGFESQNHAIGFLAEKRTEEFFDKLNMGFEIKFLAGLFGYFNWMASICSSANNYGKDFDFPVATSIAKIGSSDAHLENFVGASCSLVQKKLGNLEDLRNVLKNKETKPIMNPIWFKNTTQEVVLEELLNLYQKEIKGTVANLYNRHPFLFHLLKFLVIVLKEILE